VISALVSCEGIVLRNLRYGETSRIATLFTPELGKIGIIAKGARDPKSPFGASLEFLSHGSFVVYHRPGRDLHFLRAGALEREFRGLFRDSDRFILASAFVEFLERVLQGEEPAGELFDFALRGLQVLETAPRPALPELFRGMQLRVASILGYAPRLEQCLRCGRVVGEAASAGARGAWTFMPADGGVLCPECGAREPGEAGPRLSPRALRRLHAMAVGRPGAPDHGTRPSGSIPARATTPAGAETANVGVSYAGAADAGSACARATDAGTSGDGAAMVRDRPSAPDPAWIALLDGLVEDFLRYHLDSYRGLRALGALSGAGFGAAGFGTKGRGGGA
jgi:DNA repair protein RecO (recombination protein O)